MEPHTHANTQFPTTLLPSVEICSPRSAFALFFFVLTHKHTLVQVTQNINLAGTFVLKHAHLVASHTHTYTS